MLLVAACKILHGVEILQAVVVTIVLVSMIEGSVVIQHSGKHNHAMPDANCAYLLTVSGK